MSFETDSKYDNSQLRIDRTQLDEPRLVGVKGEPEACEPCL